MSSKKVLLTILDGWGIGNQDTTDGVFLAKTPFIDSLKERAASTTLKTYGHAVGLPKGQMGNSEVGHINIGAGRVVWQMLVRINKAFEENTFATLATAQKLVQQAKANPKAKIHLMGLLSDGGVHSSQEHLHHLLKWLAKEDLGGRTLIHAFTDGRDTDPEGGAQYLTDLQENADKVGAHIASVVGRYYAMDRDKRWERTAVAYNAMVRGEGQKTEDVVAEVKQRYAIGETDEFIQPILSQHFSPICEGDIVLCFNFRTDRGRQISTVLTQQDIADHGMKKMNLHYYTMTQYDKTYKEVDVLFSNDDLAMTLGEVLSKSGKTQLRAAETEKYPHVTFFFNGGRETPFEGEMRVMAASPKVATYDLQPEMSAVELTDKVLNVLHESAPDFVCINYANPDMVGHTGVQDAIIRACETADTCAARLISAAVEKGYSVIVIADHGNADKMTTPAGEPHTAHTTNPVPCYLLDDDVKTIKEGKLADIAPTVLSLLGLPIPKEMDGESLFSDIV